MNKYLLIILSTIFICTKVSAQQFEGGIEKQEYLKSNRIIDAATNMPISDAEITVPQTNFKTRTDSNGYFTLWANSNADLIISVQKDGYRPFTTTFLKDTSTPLKLSLVKEQPMDINIECDMCHLGDDTYSSNSANSGDFKIKSTGPFYSKSFKIPSGVKKHNCFIVIGSIIGVDTQLARKMGQNSANSYATPPEVFFNGAKISEIQLNGDNQKIKIPNNLIKENDYNEVTIRTGHNVLQSKRFDYDDIEFMNLSFQSE
jgi:hypothetical protein